MRYLLKPKEHRFPVNPRNNTMHNTTHNTTGD